VSEVKVNTFKLGDDLYEVSKFSVEARRSFVYLIEVNKERATLNLKLEVLGMAAHGYTNVISDQLSDDMKISPENGGLTTLGDLEKEHPEDFRNPPIVGGAP
jgi:hypothetical protein